MRPHTHSCALLQLPVRPPTPAESSHRDHGATSANDAPAASAEADGTAGPVITRKGRGLKAKDDKAKLEPSFVPRGAFFLHDDRFAAGDEPSAAEGAVPKAVPSRGRGKKLWDPFEDAGNRWAHDKFDAHQRKEEDKPPIATLKAEIKLPNPAHRASPQKSTKGSEPTTVTPSKHPRAQRVPSPVKETQDWGDIVSSPAKPAKAAADLTHADTLIGKAPHAVKEGLRRTKEVRAAPPHRFDGGKYHSDSTRDTSTYLGKPSQPSRGKHGYGAPPVAASPLVAAFTSTVLPVASTTSTTPASVIENSQAISFTPGKLHTADTVQTQTASSEIPTMGAFSRVEIPSMFSPMPPQAHDMMSQYGPGAVVTPGGLVVYPSAVGGITHNAGGVTLMQSPTGEFIPAPMLPFFPQMPMQLFPPAITPEALMHAASLAGMQFQPSYQAEMRPVQQHTADASHTGTNIHAAEFVPASRRR
jgi:hypothetical protein